MHACCKCALHVLRTRSTHRAEVALVGVPEEKLLRLHAAGREDVDLLPRRRPALDGVRSISVHPERGRQVSFSPDGEDTVSESRRGKTGQVELQRNARGDSGQLRSASGEGRHVGHNVCERGDRSGQFDVCEREDR